MKGIAWGINAWHAIPQYIPLYRPIQHKSENADFPCTSTADGLLLPFVYIVYAYGEVCILNMKHIPWL